MRAIAVYISRILCYPASEYEVRDLTGKRTVKVSADGSFRTDIISAADIGEPYVLDGINIYRTEFT